MVPSIQNQKVKNLEDLKDKWRAKLSCFLVESAWMGCDMNADRADAALERLYQERDRSQHGEGPGEGDGPWAEGWEERSGGSPNDISDLSSDPPEHCSACHRRTGKPGLCPDCYEASGRAEP